MTAWLGTAGAAATRQARAPNMPAAAPCLPLVMFFQQCQCVAWPQMVAGDVCYVETNTSVSMRASKHRMVGGCQESLRVIHQARWQASTWPAADLKHHR